MSDLDREPTADETRGMDWWNALSKAERGAWMARTGSAVPPMHGPPTNAA